MEWAVQKYYYLIYDNGWRYCGRPEDRVGGRLGRDGGDAGGAAVGHRFRRGHVRPARARVRRRGRLIKYIPYPVVTGYMSGVGLLIMLKQIVPFLGLEKNAAPLAGLFSPGAWQWPAVCVAVVTAGAMVAAPRLTKRVPAAILGLAAGIAAHLAAGLLRPQLLSLDANPFIIGAISTSPGVIYKGIISNFSALRLMGAHEIYPPISPDQVRVFEAGDEITVPYEKIAIITAEGDTDLTNKAAMIKKMKKKAAELGANGLILGKFKEATTGQKISQVLLWTSANDKMEATAIRLKTKKRPARPVAEEEEGY